MLCEGHLKQVGCPNYVISVKFVGDVLEFVFHIDTHINVKMFRGLDDNIISET
jgi:hypothetical protein